ncbi:hypothetical protein HID58_081007 [Brassica napus]|uniref:Replication protein A 70 kDa DNA-binding subunit B/D first OB fold domain-containing protein n=1 Tax=Brassica napus TaxID=3708 RepID=A0ABQ7Y6K2_BRANA|nr:hypothetical protein HID58_081007 [Brassica napus]
MANFDQVSALKPFKTMWRIRVKIIWVWKQYSARAGENIEMVLVDPSASHKELRTFSATFHSIIHVDLIEGV